MKYPLKIIPSAINSIVLKYSWKFFRDYFTLRFQLDYALKICIIKFFNRIHYALNYNSIATVACPSFMSASHYQI